MAYWRKIEKQEKATSKPVAKKKKTSQNTNFLWEILRGIVYPQSLFTKSESKPKDEEA